MNFMINLKFNKIYIEKQQMNQILQKSYKDEKGHYPQDIHELKIKRAGNIDQIQLSFNQTFVISYWSAKDYKFEHIDKGGIIISQLQWSFKKFRKILMVTQEEAIILDHDQKNQQDHIIIWNLNKKICASITIPFSQKGSWSCSSTIEFFRQTHLLCYCQSRKTKNFSLSYFRLPLNTEDKPFHTYQFFGLSEEQQLSFRATKLNQHSMMGFLPTKYISHFQQNLKFYVYRINDPLSTQFKGESLTLTVNFGHMSCKDIDFLNARISDIWQINPSQFYIQCEIFADVYKYQRSKEKSLFNEGIHEGYRNFYWNFQTNKIRLSSLTFTEPHRIQFVNTIRTLNYIEEDHWSIERRIAETYTTAFQPEYPPKILVPIFYVQSHTQKVFTQIYTPTAWVWSYKLVWPDCFPNYMIEQNNNSKTQETEITFKEFPFEWFISSQNAPFLPIFYLLEIFPYFDQDILREVSKLIDQS